jgi:phage terminase large subunit-like protein
LYALTKAIQVALEYGCDVVGIETDQGGETWGSVYREAAHSLELKDNQIPRLRYARAGSIGPKTHRASMMLTDYEKGRITHVWGTHGVLEKSLRRFPKTKPFDLVDAAFWAWRDLRPGRRKRLIVR